LQGTCSDEEIERVREFHRRMQDDNHPLWVLKPDLGQRNMQYMVREALLRGADSIIIDQLTYVEFPNPNKPRTERIGEGLHTLAGLVSTGRNRVPVMVMHQISREGVKAADKDGRLKMEHMAESAEVERTGHWVFGLYRSAGQRPANRASMSLLAARREDNNSWELEWNLNMGRINVLREEQG
jgi:hypothetical protein